MANIGRKGLNEIKKRKKGYRTSLRAKPRHRKHIGPMDHGDNSRANAVGEDDSKTFFLLYLACVFIE